MKEIVILSCWPSTENRENQLFDLVNRLKKLNKEVLIASHYPIPDYIASQADYYIFDKHNLIYTSKTLNTHQADCYFNTTSFKLDIINIVHSAALCRILNLALSFIENLGYDYFTFMESDAELNSEDLNKLMDIKYKLIEHNKKLFFFKLDSYEFPFWENNGIFEVYETFYFGGFLKEFNSKIKFPKTADEWDKTLLLDKNNHIFECFVTNAFSKYKEDYYILRSTHNEFSNSKINTFSSVLGYDGVYYNVQSEYFPVLFLYNEGKKPKTYKIFSSIWMPSVLSKEITLEPDHWWYTYINVMEHNQDIKVLVYEEDKLIKNLNILVDNEWLNREKNRKQIIFK